MEPIDFLRQYPPFDHLSQPELTQVQAQVEVVRFARGEAILRPGDPPSRYLYIIQSGTVSLLDHGRVYQVLEEGETFGYSSLISRTTPGYDVVAASNVVSYRLPEALFRQLLDNVDFAEYFLKSLAERLRRTAAQHAPSAERSLATPIKYLMAAPIFIESDATIQAAAQRMHEAHVSSILVRSEPLGILTDRDLRGRVLAVGLGPATPVAEVMSRPLKWLDSDAPVYAALQYMLEENIHHLALIEEGEVVGVVADADLLRHQARSPLYLQRQLDNLENVAQLHSYAQEVAAIVETLHHGGLGVTPIGHIISSLNDTLIRRLAKLAEAELGPPPTPYAWLVFGSEGRAEQLLLTDQDNAIVYAEQSSAAQSYFSQLARRVIDGLLQAGFPPCPGGYMATNWCKPLAEWTALFAHWVTIPEPKALMEASIFFDFRTVHGELALDALEQSLVSASQNGIFIGHMVRAAQEFAPPLGFFGRIRSEDGLVDLKKGGIAPIVGLARACALAAGSRQRSTRERLVSATEAGKLSGEGAEILAETFQFLMGLRLREQLAALKAGQTPTNQVRVEGLSTVERRHLKDAFVSIRQMQDGIGAAFQTSRLG